MTFRCMSFKPIMNVPEKIIVTASLTVEYKAPTRADQVRTPSSMVIETGSLMSREVCHFSQ